MLKKIVPLIIIFLLFIAIFPSNVYASFPGLPDRTPKGTLVDCGINDVVSEQLCLSCGGSRACAKGNSTSYCCEIVGDGNCRGKRPGDNCVNGSGSTDVRGTCDSALYCIPVRSTPIPVTPTRSPNYCTSPDFCEQRYNNPSDPTRFCFSRTCTDGECGGRWLPAGTPCGGGKVCHSDGLCETPRSTVPTSTPTPIPGDASCSEDRQKIELSCCDTASNNGRAIQRVVDERNGRQCAVIGNCQYDYTLSNLCFSQLPEENPGATIPPERPTPTPRPGGGGQTAPTRPPSGGGGEAEPTEAPEVSCSVPQELSNDEPVVIENYPEWSTVTLHWVGDASSYEIRASDNDETSTAVVSPAGTNNCGDGHSEDLCMTNWRSNRITVRARSGKSYIWSVKAIGSCTSDEASGSFSTASGRGSDNTLPTLTPPGGGGAVGSTGQCPDGSGAYTCTYSETDGQCYGGTEGTGHNQAGCNWKCGPVTCPTSGGGSAPALPPGGTVPGLPGRGAPPGGGGSVQPTVDPLNNQCRKTEVTFKLEQDGTNLNLTVRPKSQPEEGMTEYTDEFTIGSERLDSSKCEAYFKKQDGSYYRECKGVVRPQDAGKQVVWTHSWKKGCVSSGGRIVCSGPPCSESTNRTMEDISCEKNKVRLDVQVNKATNKITYKIVSSDSSEGTNEIHDIRPIKPYIETSCNGITSGLYLPLPVGPGLGEVCTLKTNPAGTYTWIHEWTKARGSRGDNRNPARCSSDPLTYQITSDGTVINNPTPAPAGSGSPTAAPALPTLTPTPLPTCSPTSELNNKAGQQAAEIIITPTCRQP